MMIARRAHSVTCHFFPSSLIAGIQLPHYMGYGPRADWRGQQLDGHANRGADDA
jgi:hypothetical protein